jgi:galactonate dehydratase
VPGTPSSRPFVVKKGFVDVPTGPGLGIELDEDAVKKKIGHKWRSTESYDEEGSVVDW